LHVNHKEGCLRRCGSISSSSCWCQPLRCHLSHVSSDGDAPLRVTWLSPLHPRPSSQVRCFVLRPQPATRMFRYYASLCSKLGGRTQNSSCAHSTPVCCSQTEGVHPDLASFPAAQAARWARVRLWLTRCWAPRGLCFGGTARLRGRSLKGV
jgi:hypothetical protein